MRVGGRTAGWSATVLWALAVLAAVPMLFLASVNEPSSARNAAFVAFVILAFSSVGALVASRRPENPIGWLFLAGALLWASGELASEYAVYALITAPGALPAGAWLGWFGGWVRGVGWFLVVVFPLLLFPTGRPPSPRWRPVLWGAAIFVVFFTLMVWISPTSDDVRLSSVRNPLGLELEVAGLLGEVVYFVLPLLLVACGAAVIVRFRRSRGDERQQLKWFAYAVAVMVLLFGSWLSLAVAGLVPPNALMWTVPLLGLPVGVGVAVLRYRLYDIDLVINRTLVYGSLTATLVAIYLGVVVGMQTLLRTLTSQTEQPQLAVVASTLVIAALFSPLRRRIQSFIDRRFYRSRYDARRTLEAFSARLRADADLGALNDHLIEAVRETVQPEHASLWLRAGSERRP